LNSPLIEERSQTALWRYAVEAVLLLGLLLTSSWLVAR
jgi:hypothetical protein